jgi:hypothetical protein
VPYDYVRLKWATLTHTCHILEAPDACTFYPEDGGINFFQNVGTSAPNTGHHTPEDCNLITHPRENFNPQIYYPEVNIILNPEILSRCISS